MVRQAFVVSNSAEEINSILAHIYTFLERVPQCAFVSAYSSNVAGNPVTIQHSLGEVPDDVFASAGAAMTVHATTDDRKLWTSSSVVVRGSAANQLMNLMVVKF